VERAYIITMMRLRGITKRIMELLMLAFGVLLVRTVIPKVSNVLSH
jgi:hypothetical protein